MALKFKITKADYDKLPDEIKGEYTLTGDSATLDLEGGPDPKAGEKFERERDRRRAAEKRAADAELRAAELDDKAGDLPALEAKHTKEVKKLTDERDAATKKFSDFASRSLKDTVANDIASKLTKSPAVLRPHILSRVTVDLTGDEPKTVFLDKDGKPSTLTAADIEKEFRDNKDFAAIIVGTHASGGGASRQSSNGNGHPGLQQQQHQQQAGPVSLASLDAKSLANEVAARAAARAGNTG